MAWNVYIASVTRCLSCMGKTFSQPLRHILHVSRLPFCQSTSNRIPNSFFLQSLQKCPVRVRRTVVPALAGKAKHSCHFRSLVRPSCRTIAYNFFSRRLEVLFISTSSLESPAMFLQYGMGRIRNENGTIPCLAFVLIARLSTLTPSSSQTHFTVLAVTPRVLCVSRLLNRQGPKRMIVEKKGRSEKK